MSEKENTYKKIIRSTSLFGLVQLSNLIISALRHKFFAVIIGPAGYGTLSLLYSSFDIIRQVSGLGLDVAGVKKISENNNNPVAKYKTAALIIKLSVITGGLGTLLFIAASYNLSKWIFGNTSQVLILLLISIAVLFRQVIAGQTAVMQGEGKLRYLAKTNLLGNLFGLFLTLPLFIFFKTAAILPSILVSAVVTLAVSCFYYNKMEMQKYNVSYNVAFKEGKDILYFGGLIAINGFLPVVANYIIQLYINAISGLAEVGLYNTGQVIIISYMGIVFSAMTMEYYPRLASYNKDGIKEGNAVSQQVIISILLIIPVILAFLGFMPLIIKILFSAKFLSVIPMLSWLVIAMFFKAVSFCMGYVIIARADSSVFLKTSIVFNALYIGLCIGGYYFGGLEGLGIAYLIYYVIHLISIYLIVKFRYGLIYDAKLYKLFMLGLLNMFILVGIIKFTDGIIKYAVLLILFIIFGVLFIKEASKHFNIKEFIAKKIKKV